ncbi:Nuclear import receptor [Savitreella phatthalungensis]
MSAALAQYSELLGALNALYTATDRATRDRANEYLEKFQKSVDAWQATHAILAAPESDPSATQEARLFAAQTLRRKLQLDVHQLPRESMAPLRDSLLQMLTTYATAPKALRTQLCVALATLALHMSDWADPVSDVSRMLVGDASSAGVSAWETLLSFLTILPEEVNESRRTLLSEQELQDRIRTLLEKNGQNVLHMLGEYANRTSSTGTAALCTCLQSWLREIPLQQVAASRFVDLAFGTLASEGASDDSDTFEAAVDLVSTMLRETSEVNEALNAQIVEILFPRVMALHPRLLATKSDPDAFRGYARVLSEAGEAWVILIARMPQHFAPLVQAIADTTAIDEDLEVVKFTFNFWYHLRQSLEAPKHAEAKQLFTPVYISLVDAMINHLHYPTDAADESDLFDGDREAEDKFRSFRHDMGDVLKDSCVVVGGRECLTRAYNRVSELLEKGKTQAVRWQDIEAVLFSMRAMAREISLDEDQVLPHIMNMLLNLPEHPKIRYAATLVLGRYTEWTAQHQDYLLPQLNYITSGFSTAQNTSKDADDVTSAAAQALKHFCRDCSKLLIDHIEQLYGFYAQAQPSLDFESAVEVTEGIGHVVAALPLEKQYAALSAFVKPIGDRIAARCETPTTDEAETRKLADHIELCTVFAFTANAYVDARQAPSHPCVRVFEELWPTLSRTLDTYGHLSFISERICSCIKTQLQSYRQHALGLLPLFADKLAAEFDRLHYGCFLWVSGACVRQFADPEYNPPPTVDAVWAFVGRQSTALFALLEARHGNPQAMPDVIEDFFRLLIDALLANPQRFLAPESQSTPASTSFLDTVLIVSLIALKVRQADALQTVLHFLRDLTGWLGATPPTSGQSITPEVKHHLAVAIVRASHVLTRMLVIGLAHEYPRDATGDASAVVVALLEGLSDPAHRNTILQAILAALTAGPVESTAQQACAPALVPLTQRPTAASAETNGHKTPQDHELEPADIWISLDPATVGSNEAQKLVQQIYDAIQDAQSRKARAVLADFAAVYRRRVAAR